jgi:hypothetical protein
MSYELHVYLNDERLPTRDEWQQALNEHNCELLLDDFSPRTHTGFLPARFNGLKCGFEYYYDPIGGDVPEDVAQAIGPRDHFVAARLFSDKNEGQAAMLALATLAERFDGVFCDPQSGELIAGADVFEWMKQGEIAERAGRMSQAVSKWANLTERKCPECGAPWPEYRKTCMVCEFEIGRA